MGAAGVTAFATSMPWFLALGALGCGILAWERMGELRADQAGDRFRLQQPRLEALGDEARRLAQEGHRAAQSVLSEIGSAPPFAQELFTVAAGEIRGLHEKYQSLVRRQDEIARYLGGTDLRRLEGERDEMRRRAEAADDDAEREQYGSASSWLEQSIASHRDLSRDASRIVARLAGIRAALSSAGAKVIRVKSAEARAAAGEGEEVAQALSALGGEVDALNEAVDEVFVRTRQAPPRQPVVAQGRRGK